jgi:hypothetical protein
VRNLGPRGPGHRKPLIAAAALLFLAIGCGPEAVGSWTATGLTVEVGFDRTATMLNDGRVLVVGGWDGAAFVADEGTGFQDAAELYDPTQGSWTATEPMHDGRNGHTATLLRDGTVLVIGGDGIGGDGTAAALSSAEVYDPGAGTWMVTASQAESRSGHTATLLTSGLVLVVGGYNADHQDGLASAELYDPATGTWTATGSLAGGRAGQTATRLLDGKVLVAGGSDGSGRLATTEIYDPATGSWATAGPMSGIRNDHTATLLADGRVLVTGGLQPSPSKTTAIFDPAAGTWTDATPMTTSRHDHAATLLTDGSVLVAGGSGAGTTLGTAERYVPSTNSWIPTGPMVDDLTGRSAVVLSDGRVLVSGGATTIEPVRLSELFSLPGGS